MALIIKRKERIPHSFEQLVNGLIKDIYQDEKSPKTKKEEKTERRFNPAINVIEKEHSYVLEFALPGWTKKDVEITLDQNILRITGNKKTEFDSKSTYHSYEIDYGVFEKSFELPEKSEFKVNAELANGLLKVVVEKIKEREVKKTIQVG